MSGSTIGGIAGGIIGFVVTGFNPAGARWGFMIGSAVGGYLDPVQQEGPRIGDAQAQTSNEGVPRAIVYGKAAISGNIIQVGPLIEHKKVEGGKGGPEVTTYTYTRTVAIRICEAAPLGGKMVLRRAWADDKLVYDASQGGLLAAGNEKFASAMQFYSGDEDQLPDPTLEALPAEYGGGVGNVPAHRGSCYAVLVDVDCTARQGSLPQMRWEVCSEATEQDGIGTPTISGQTHAVTLGGSDECAYIGYLASGVSYGESYAGIGVGSEFEVGNFSDTLAAQSSRSIANAGDSPGDERQWPRAYNGSWQISYGGNSGQCRLLYNGAIAADLRPTVGWPANWWYAEASFTPGFGELIWFSGGNVYIGVRRVGSGAGVIHNKIYRWPIANANGDVVEAEATSPTITAGLGVIFVHMDRGGQMRAIATSESELITYDGDLAETTRESLPMSLSGLKGFAVDSGLLLLYFPGVLRIYRLDGFTLLQTVSITGTLSPWNNQIICSDHSIFLRSGVNLKRIAYQPTCLVGLPDGWYTLPDATGYATNGDIVVPFCSTPVKKVTSNTVLLSAIVTDLCERAGINAAQVDVSALAGMEVIGYPIARETNADSAVLELMRVYFFELPEWGNSGDTGTKLRAVKRGGASLLTLTEDDIIEVRSDEFSRPQQLEFPRKLSLTGVDPDANYEPATESAERESENIKAVGEERASTSVVMSRDELAAVAEKMLKVATAEASGRLVRTVPLKFSGYTPSDRLIYNQKRYRIERALMSENGIEWDMVADRASAAVSNATGSVPQPPTVPPSTARGPTIFAAMNISSLRSSDTVPGMYLAVQGLLPGWSGADIYLSVDGGLSEQLVTTITQPATMGRLVDDCTDSSEPIIVKLRPGGELDSVTEDQLAARMNGFAIITDGVTEVGQFQDADEVADLEYELTNVTRGQLGSVAVPHYTGDMFVVLDTAVVFLPLDVSLSGKTLIFRAVTLGSPIASNPTLSVVFDPPTFIRHGGVVAP